VGLRGRVFQHYRFRKMKGEPPKLTRFGRFISSLSLDDLPTLLNVIKGDLSLVGPRPFAPEEVNLHDPVWKAVLSVKPGLTGLSLLMLKGRYNQATLSERLQPELWYAEHGSFRTDMQILGATLVAWLRMGHVKGKI